MGWLPSASDSNTSTSSNSNTSQYGTRTPNLSPQWQTQFNNILSSLNMPVNSSSGYVAPPNTAKTGTTQPSTYTVNGYSYNADGTPATATSTQPFAYTPTNGYGQIGANKTQQTALDFQNKNLLNSPVDAAVASINPDLQYFKGALGDYVNKPLWDIENQTAPQATASTSANAPLVNAQTGASAMTPYMTPLNDAYVNSSLDSYQHAADKGYNSLTAANAGAFGNKRTGVAQGVFQSDSALGAGNLAAGLRLNAFNTAAGLGQQDANRTLSADTTNAGNLLSNNQFNANLLTDTSKFNVGAQQTNTNQKLAAAGQMAASIAQQTGIDEGILNNIVTANGIDTKAAQALFDNGTITQAQLQALLESAGAGNGSSFTSNTDQSGSSNSNTAKFSIG